MKEANATPPTIGIREETTQILGIYAHKIIKNLELKMALTRPICASPVGEGGVEIRKRYSRLKSYVI